jgi:hypothetical protein
MKINLTSGPAFGALIALLFWTWCGGLNSAQASCRIENISLERAGKFTRVTVYADQPWQMVHSTEPAKDGKPYRVIIDCKDALFALPQNNFEQGLPGGTIQRIRTSQYRVVPEKIVRVVLDVKGPVVYEVLERADKRKATIALLTEQDANFPTWTAVSSPKEGTPGAMVKNQTPTVPSQPEPAWNKADAGQNAVQPKVLRRRATKSAVPLGPTFERESLTDKGTKDKVESTQSAEKLVSAPVSSEKAEEVRTQPAASSESKQTLVRLAPRRRHINRYLTPLGPYPEEATVAQASQPGENVKPQELATEVAAKPAGTIVEGIGKILGPESVAAKETHLVPESLMVAQQGTQMEAGLSPQRKLVTYHPGTKKDPFVPLTEKKDMTFGMAPLPLFENLRLVGILQDQAGNRALLEDEMGWGYILMAGDRIRNGYVINVEDDKATFQVEEYGGYRTTVLELNPE